MLTISCPDGDLPAGIFSVIGGGESLRQRCQQRCRLWRGEWFLDTGAGVPYLEEVVSVRPIGLAAAVVASEIRKVDGVEVISDVRIEQIDDADEPERRFRLSFRVNDQPITVTA